MLMDVKCRTTMQIRPLLQALFLSMNTPMASIRSTMTKVERHDIGVMYSETGQNNGSMACSSIIHVWRCLGIMPVWSVFINVHRTLCTRHQYDRAVSKVLSHKLYCLHNIYNSQLTARSSQLRAHKPRLPQSRSVALCLSCLANASFPFQSSIGLVWSSASPILCGEALGWDGLGLSRGAVSKADGEIPRDAN